MLSKIKLELQYAEFMKNKFELNRKIEEPKLMRLVEFSTLLSKEKHIKL